MASKSFKSALLMAVDNETGQDIPACHFILTNGIAKYHLSGTTKNF
jgi:hypothetical protein